MTVAADPVAPTSAQLLYMAIDLGDRPLLSTFSKQVGYVGDLFEYCWALTWVKETPPPQRSAPRDVTQHSLIEEDAEYIPDAKVHIVRTSLASPWATILGSAADKSVPIAYAMAALFSLRQLLEMVKDWQEHRLNVAERRSKMETPFDPTHQERSVAELLASHLSRQTGVRKGNIRVPGPSPEPAIEALGTVVTAEMIDPDDPRASGSTS